MKSVKVFSICLAFCLSLSGFVRAENGVSDLKTSQVKLGSAITGFTVIHGSAKSEEAELLLLASQLAGTDTLFYFPETDMTTAHYFNEYLRGGDEGLLRELVYDYRHKVPQEASVETFLKWQRLREMSSGKCVQVVGVDIPWSYLFSLRYLSDIFVAGDPVRDRIAALIDREPAGYAIGPCRGPVRNFMDSLSADYFAHRTAYTERVSDPDALEGILGSLKDAYNVLSGKVQRDRIMADNYIALRGKNGYGEKPQFFRMGIFHMMKHSFLGMSPGFMAILTEEEGYMPSGIHIVMGLLCNSSVMGIRSYAENGELEQVRAQSENEWTGGDLAGMIGLSQRRVSDLTYVELGGRETEHTRMEEFPWKLHKEYTIGDYVDACVLIWDSEAALPIESVM